MVQYDLKRNKRKIIAFLFPSLTRYGWAPCGTFGSALSPDGAKLYITWNGNRRGYSKRKKGKLYFDTCALTVIHIPESERRP